MDNDEDTDRGRLAHTPRAKQITALNRAARNSNPGKVIHIDEKAGFYSAPRITIFNRLSECSGDRGRIKVRHRGLAKNENRLHLRAGFTNLLIGRKFMPA